MREQIRMAPAGVDLIYLGVIPVSGFIFIKFISIPHKRLFSPADGPAGRPVEGGNMQVNAGHFVFSCSLGKRDSRDDGLDAGQRLQR